MENGLGESTGLPPLDRCPRCDYSLSGLPLKGECPECGFGYSQSTLVLNCTNLKMPYLANATVPELVSVAPYYVYFAWQQLGGQPSSLSFRIGVTLTLLMAISIFLELLPRLSNSGKPRSQLFCSEKGFLLLRSSQQSFWESFLGLSDFVWGLSILVCITAIFSSSSSERIQTLAMCAVLCGTAIVFALKVFGRRRRAQMVKDDSITTLMNGATAWRDVKVHEFRILTDDAAFIDLVESRFEWFQFGPRSLVRVRLHCNALQAEMAFRLIGDWIVRAHTSPH